MFPETWARGTGASVRRVTPRLPLALAVAALTVAGSACTTFTDTDVVARVGDAELSRDEFEDRLTELGVTDEQVLALDPVRDEITRWIQLELIGSAEIATAYELGAEESGVVCVSAIVVADEAAADDALAQLDSGSTFAEVFETENLDETLIATGGALPCLTSSDIADSSDVAFVAVGGRLTADDPFGAAPINDTQGNEAAWVVLGFRAFEDLSPDDTDAVVSVIGATIETTDADIYVAPRYGVFDADVGRVVALG